MNKIQISSLTLVTIFITSIATAPQLSAATPPKQFNDKGHCIAVLSGTHTEGSGKNKKTVDDYTKRELLTYLETRVKIRESKLGSIEQLLNVTRANFNYYNGKEPTVRAAVDAVNAKKIESLDGLAADPALDFGQGSIPGRTLDMGAFENSYAHARGIITNARNVVKGDAGSTRANIIEAACASIFDARIFGELVPLAKRSYILSRVDILNLMNSGLNVSRQYAMASVYNAKKASDPAFDTDGAMVSSAGWGANPAYEQGVLGSIAAQAGGDAVALNGQLNQVADSILTKKDDLSSTFSDILGAQAEKKQ